MALRISFPPPPLPAAGMSALNPEDFELKGSRHKTLVLGPADFIQGLADVLEPAPLGPLGRLVLETLSE